MSSGRPANRPKPEYLLRVEAKVDQWVLEQNERRKSLGEAMDAFEAKVRFPDRDPAIYGGLGHFYTISLQDLREGKEAFFRVAAPGLKEKMGDASIQEKLLNHFRGKIFFKSRDKARPLIPLEAVRLARWGETNGVVEHPDFSHMETIAMNKKEAAFVKVAFRLADPEILQDVGDREFFDIVQPGREGERVLIYNALDQEFVVDHAADIHIRMRGYRTAVNVVQKILKGIEHLYRVRAIGPETAAQWKDAWFLYLKNLDINYNEQVRQWLRWEQERYRGGTIDFVVVHGDEVDNVNDSQSLAQKPFAEENTRFLAYLLYEAGIPVLIETGNHPRHRPNYFESQHSSNLNTDPNRSPSYQDHEKKYHARIADSDLGYGTIDYLTGIPRALTPKAAGEPQVIEQEGFLQGAKTFFENTGIILRELLLPTLFDAPPQRQTTDDQFRANQYLYINSEPNLALRYKGHTFLITDTGAEDFRFARYLEEIAPSWMHGVAGYLFAFFLPGLWDGIYRYAIKQEVPAKGYPDAALNFFIDRALESHQGSVSGPDTTHSSHFPWFHFLKRIFGDDFSSNTVNRQPRRAVLLIFWYFRPLVINAHIHQWEAFAFDFDLSPEKKRALAEDLHQELQHMARHEPPESSEHFQKEMGAIWEKFELDDHLVMPTKVRESNGQNVPQVLEAYHKDPDQYRPFFVTLESSGPNDDQDPAGVLTQTIRHGRTARLEATSLFFNRDGSVTTVPLADAKKESLRRKELAKKTFPPRPPEPPTPLYDPYEGILP